LAGGCAGSCTCSPSGRCWNSGFASLPNSDTLHAATEKFSPDGLYGKWFSLVMVVVCGLWLMGAWLIDRVRRRQPANVPMITNLGESH